MPDKQGKRSENDPNALKAFIELNPETREALDAMQYLVRFSAGQVVTHEGEESEFVGIVASGILRMQKTLADGRHPIIGLLVEGDIFGRVFDGATEVAIEAATDTEVYAFSRGPFETLLKRSPDLDRVVLLNILNELDRTRDWMVILSNEKIVDRVAGFLLFICTRFVGVDHMVQGGRDGIEVKIPVTRLDLAHFLGTRPESISRAFHALADAGDISIIAPDCILILKAGALAERAGEEDLYSVAKLRNSTADKKLRR